MMTKI